MQLCNALAILHAKPKSSPVHRFTLRGRLDSASSRPPHRADHPVHHPLKPTGGSKSLVGAPFFSLIRCSPDVRPSRRASVPPHRHRRSARTYPAYMQTLQNSPSATCFGFTASSPFHQDPLASPGGVPKTHICALLCVLTRLLVPFASLHNMCALMLSCTCLPVRIPEP